MYLNITFLGPHSQDLLKRYRASGFQRTSLTEMAELTQHVLVLSDLFLEGFGSFSVTASSLESPDSYHARLTHASRVKYVNRLQIALSSRLDRATSVLSEALSPSGRAELNASNYDVETWRDLIISLIDYLTLLQPCISTSVSHTTLREWLFGIHDSSRLGAYCYLESRDKAHKALVSKIAGGNDPSETWLISVLEEYGRRDTPMKRADLISFGVDLAVLYQAQMAYALAQDDSTPALRSDNLNRICDFVASSIAQWAGEDVLKLPKTLDCFNDGAFWRSVFQQGGAQVFRMSEPDSKNHQCKPPAQSDEYLSPLLLRRILNEEGVCNVFDRIESKYDWVDRYSYFHSLESLVDAATYYASSPGFGRGEKRLLISPVPGGLVMMASGSRSWRVYYISKAGQSIANDQLDKPDAPETNGWCSDSVILRGGVPIQSTTPFHGVEYHLLPRLCILGFIGFVESSGVVFDRLLGMADSLVGGPPLPVPVS